jgi:hypothetical protein
LIAKTITPAMKTPDDDHNQVLSFFDFICHEWWSCAWRDNGTAAVPVLKRFLNQWLSPPARSMCRIRIARNCVKELPPAHGNWLTGRVMTLFRNYQNDEDLLEDVHPFGTLANAVHVRQ